jgi:hypothetical protein
MYFYGSRGSSNDNLPNGFLTDEDLALDGSTHFEQPPPLPKSPEPIVVQVQKALLNQKAEGKLTQTSQPMKKKRTGINLPRIEESYLEQPSQDKK